MYEVLPNGHCMCPQNMVDYVILILNDLDQKFRYIPIMDDLLIHSLTQAHWELVKDLLKSMIKMGSKEVSTILHYSDLYGQ